MNIMDVNIISCAHCHEMIDITLSPVWDDNSGEPICDSCKEKEDDDIEKWYKNLSNHEKNKLSKEFSEKIKRNRA